MAIGMEGQPLHTTEVTAALAREVTMTIVAPATQSQVARTALLAVATIAPTPRAEALALLPEAMEEDLQAEAEECSTVLLVDK